MRYGNPDAFWFLLLIPCLALFYTVAFRQRRKALTRFGGQLTERLLLANSPLKQKMKATLITFSVLWMALALVEPKWGFHMLEVKRRGIDLVIALDVSKSMLAEDIKPNRLARAKLEIESLFDRLKGDRVALVGFAGGSFIQCPLTLDYATARLFLDDMHVHSIPQGGTDIGGAILKSIAAFEGSEQGKQAILFLTDGEDHKGKLTEALNEAKKRDIPIYPVGIGKTEGAPIPSLEEGDGSRYLRDRQGEIVLSKLDPHLLEKIAVTTGGKVGLLGTGSFSLEDLYEKEIETLEKRELESQQKKEYHHRFQWPVAFALFLLTLEGLINERR